MLNPTYRLTLGNTRIETSDVSSTHPVLALRTDADLDTPAAALDVWLGEPEDISIAPGDATKLELGYESDLTTAFTGVVDRVKPDLSRLHVQALTDSVKLLRLRVNQVYENQTAGQIVSDLAGQAGVSTGAIQDGLDFPFYVVDDARTAYQHCQDLAERSGFDLFTMPDGKLNFAAFDKAVPDHTFTYAQDVLSLEVASMPPSFERVEVWGESPASSEGSEAASWLVRDFSGSMGAAGGGSTLRLSDVSIRTKDAAQTSAEGRLATISRRATFGVAIVLGSPEVAPGDSVTFRQAPDDRLGGVFQVKRVTHRFSKAGGFLTRLELWGGGGDPLGGLL